MPKFDYVGSERRRGAHSQAHSMVSQGGEPRLRVESKAWKGDPRSPDARFVVDANRACYFGTHPRAYGMSFSESAVMHPVRSLPLSSVKHNELWKSIRSPRPSHAFVHTVPMVFDVQVPELSYT